MRARTRAQGGSQAQPGASLSLLVSGLTVRDVGRAYSMQVEVQRQRQARLPCIYGGCYLLVRRMDFPVSGPDPRPGCGERATVPAWSVRESDPTPECESRVSHWSVPILYLFLADIFSLFSYIFIGAVGKYCSDRAPSGSRAPLTAHHRTSRAMQDRPRQL